MHVAYITTNVKVLHLDRLSQCGVQHVQCWDNIE